MRERASVWLVRLIAGMGLLLFSEIGWWSNDPLAYGPAEWAVTAVVHLALGALALDLIVRFCVADVFGLLLVGGIYALIDAALITQSAFASLPLSLVSRALGLHVLGVAVPGLLLLRWLLDGKGFVPWRLAMLGVIGFAWGVWLRGYPALPANAFPAPSLAAALALIAGGLVVVGVLIRLARWAVISSGAAFRLRRWEWAMVGGALLALFLPNRPAASLPDAAAPIVGALLGYLIGALYVQRRPEPASLLDAIIPLRPVSLALYLIYAGALALLVIAGYALAGEGRESILFQNLTTLFAAFGIAWLPVASLALGVRAYRRLSREQAAS